MTSSWHFWHLSDFMGNSSIMEERQGFVVDESRIHVRDLVQLSDLGCSINSFDVDTQNHTVVSVSDNGQVYVSNTMKTVLWTYNRISLLFLASPLSISSEQLVQFRRNFAEISRRQCDYVLKIGYNFVLNELYLTIILGVERGENRTLALSSSSLALSVYVLFVAVWMTSVWCYMTSYVISSGFFSEIRGLRCTFVSKFWRKLSENKW